jgi:hypothetical protein
MRMLVGNSGASSLKLRAIEPDDTVAVSHDLPVRGPDVSGAELGKR